MTKTIIPVQLMRPDPLADDQTIGVSDHLVRTLGIPPYSSVNLRFGAFRGSVRVAPLKRNGYLRISEALGARMGLAGNEPLRVAYRNSTNTLALGPLIGVIMSRAFARQPDRPFGNMTAFCRELTDAAKIQGAFVYFFPPSGIAGDKGTIHGWIYDGGWKRRHVPLPDVLHNRLTARKLENQPNVQKLFKDAKSKHGTHVFNEKYLDKTEVFAALKKETTLQGRLPESHAFAGFDTLKSMAGKYRTVFLKPIRGSLGRGIVRISRTASGAYACHFSELNGTRKVAYPSIAKVYAAIAPRLKSQRYQIQQGLRIATVGGRPVDFRALVQKGLTGAWSVTSIVGRIAGANHFVSNLAKGGTIAPMRTAIARSGIAPAKRERSMRQLHKAAIDIARGVEATIDAHFGELGVDLAVDHAGKVWLLEVNSKPSKNDNTQLGEGRKMRPSARKLVHYARYLARL